MIAVNKLCRLGNVIFQAMKNRTKKIFVGGVPTDMTEETLKNYFIQFGEVHVTCTCMYTSMELMAGEGVHVDIDLATFRQNYSKRARMQP